MKKTIILIISVFTIILTITGCVGTTGQLGSVKLTNQLMPNMPAAEVKKILGEPENTQFIKDKWVWKYVLHQYFKGMVPYYLVFNKDTQILDSWYADEAEYNRQQNLWLKAFPATQNHNVNVNGQVDVYNR